MNDRYVLQIAICEDMTDDTALLESHIENSGMPSEHWSFESGETLVDSFRTGQYDLIFLDIYMSGMRGTEAAEKIRQKDASVVIAFTTTSPDHTLESYRLGALKYLEKPVTLDDVRETMELALLKRKTNSVIALTTAGGRREDIPLDSILYFELKNHVVEIHTSSGVLATSQSVRMDAIEKRLPSPPFLRCHRSYMVNLNYVCKADREVYAFIMKNGERADIRRGRLTQYEEMLKLWLLEKAGRYL